jgi:hypothetical protein
VHLNAGDQLTVGVPTGYQAYSYKYDVIFAGFLIQPDAATNSDRLASSLSTISTKKSTCATSTAAGIDCIAYVTHELLFINATSCHNYDIIVLHRFYIQLCLNIV